MNTVQLERYLVVCVATEVVVAVILWFGLEQGDDDALAVFLASDSCRVEVSFQHDIWTFLTHDDRADVFPSRFILPAVVSEFMSNDGEVV